MDNKEHPSEAVQFLCTSLNWEKNLLEPRPAAQVRCRTIVDSVIEQSKEMFPGFVDAAGAVQRGQVQAGSMQPTRQKSSPLMDTGNETFKGLTGGTISESWASGGSKKKKSSCESTRSSFHGTARRKKQEEQDGTTYGIAMTKEKRTRAAETIVLCAQKKMCSI